MKAWANGLTADELDRLDAAGLARTPGVARAYVSVDTDEANRWLAAARDDDFSIYLARYLGNAGISAYIKDGVPLEDFRLAYDLGLEPSTARLGITRDGVKVTGPDALQTVADYMRASKLGQDETIDAIAAGIPAAAGKEYGPRFTGNQMRELQAAGVPGKTARSLRARDREMPAATIARAHAAGITTGADWKSWQAPDDVLTFRTNGATW